MNKTDSANQLNENVKPITNNKDIENKISENIKISIKVQPLEKESNLASDIFAFSYTVTMANKSDTSVQLINRHWKVFSAGKQIADVKGEGVVGQQPLLRPMDSFEYTSWTLINDPVGSMYGTYTFKTEEDVFIDVKIEPFILSFKDRLNVH